MITIEWLDWPGAVALIGIASTLGAYWLQNNREARQLGDLHQDLATAKRDFRALAERVNKLEQEQTVQQRIAREKQKNGGAP